MASKRWLQGFPCGSLLPHGLSREILSVLASSPPTRPCSRKATSVQASATRMSSASQGHAFCPIVGPSSPTRRRHSVVTGAAGQIQAVERSAVSGSTGTWLSPVGLGVYMDVPTHVGAQRHVHRWVQTCPRDFRARGTQSSPLHRYHHGSTVQTASRLTLLGKSEMRGKAVSYTTFGGQRDQVHTSGDTHLHGIGD
jgi:hypothetical protein